MSKHATRAVVTSPRILFRHAYILLTTAKQRAAARRLALDAGLRLGAGLEWPESQNQRIRGKAGWQRLLAITRSSSFRI